MKLLTLIVLSCLTASAAPLPPVIRPVPLQSPKAASEPKTTRMVRVTTGSETYPASPISITLPLRWNLNFLGCDTNSPGCLLYDYDNVKVLQKAGYVLRIEFTDGVADYPRALAATFGAGPTDRESGFDWIRESRQRPRARFFYEVQTFVQPLAKPSMLPATPAILVNPAFPGIHPFSTPRR